jgi:hypothetical protein
MHTEAHEISQVRRRHDLATDDAWRVGALVPQSRAGGASGLGRRIVQARAAEALLKGISSGRLGEAEADVKLLPFVPAAATANRNPAVVVKRMAPIADAIWRQRVTAALLGAERGLTLHVGPRSPGRAAVGGSPSFANDQLCDRYCCRSLRSTNPSLAKAASNAAEMLAMSAGPNGEQHTDDLDRKVLGAALRS